MPTVLPRRRLRRRRVGVGLPPCATPPDGPRAFGRASRPNDHRRATVTPPSAAIPRFSPSSPSERRRRAPAVAVSRAREAPAEIGDRGELWEVGRREDRSGERSTGRSGIRTSAEGGAVAVSARGVGTVEGPPSVGRTGPSRGHAVRGAADRTKGRRPVSYASAFRGISAEGERRSRWPASRERRATPRRRSPPSISENSGPEPQRYRAAVSRAPRLTESLSTARW